MILEDSIQENVRRPAIRRPIALAAVVAIIFLLIFNLATGYVKSIQQPIENLFELSSVYG